MSFNDFGLVIPLKIITRSELGNDHACPVPSHPSYQGQDNAHSKAMALVLVK